MSWIGQWRWYCNRRYNYKSKWTIWI